MSKDPEYRIEYFQVNINVGDCEIILLIKEPDTVEKAILIDGGMSRIRVEQIEIVRKAIERSYPVSLKDGLKFDAMVITHWDADHYGGVLEMMVRDLEKQNQTVPKDNTDPLQVSYLRYESAGAPISNLYVPSLEKEKQTEKVLQGQNPSLSRPATYSDARELEFGATNKEKKEKKKKDAKAKPGDPPWEILAEKRMKRVCKLIADVDYEAEKDATKRDVLKKAFESRVKPGKLAEAFDPKGELGSQLLGLELFSGNKLDTATLTDDVVGNPKLLRNAYDTQFTDWAKKPGLFCVGVNNRYLKPNTTTADADKYRTRVPGASTPTNISSISCVIIWPNGSVSHFFAGDARSDLEEGLIQWTALKEDADNPWSPPIATTVPVVKASHHGAPSSFPLNLCQIFKPSIILFSSGNNTHLHPDWSTLFYVYAYTVSTRGYRAWRMDSGGFAFPIHLTSYPYYLKPRTPTRKGKASKGPEKEKNFPADSNPFELMLADSEYYADVLTDFANAYDLVKEFRVNAELWAAEKKKAEEEADKVAADKEKAKEDKDTIKKEKDEAYMKAKDKEEKEAQKWFEEKLKVLILPISSAIKKNYEVNYVRIMSTASESSAKIFYNEVVPGPTLTTTSALTSKPSTALNPPTQDTEGGDTKGTNPVIRAPASGSDASSGSDAYFYIMSSRVEDSDAAHAAYVIDTGTWNKFVSALSLGFIAIAGTLSSTSAEVKLHDCDEWRAWFTASLSPSSENTAVEINVSASLVNSKVEIAHFKLVVPLARSSDSNFSLSFGPSSQVGKDASSSTFDPIKHFLLFPMSANSTAITLSELVTFCNSSLDKMGLASASDLTFQLDETKSAVWFSPLMGNYSAAYRLQSKSHAASSMDANWTKFTAALKDIRLGMWTDDPTSAILVVKRKMTKLSMEDDSYCVKFPALGLFLQISKTFSAVLFFGSDSYTITLKWTEGALKSAKDLLKKVVVDVSGDSELGQSVVETFKDALAKIQKKLDILQVSIEVQNTNSVFKISRISVDAQLTLNCGSSGGDKAVVFLLSFTWPDFLFRGTLYVPDSTDKAWQKLMPDSEELLEVTPIEVSNLRSSISILDLLPNLTIDPETVPEGIPTEVTQATLQIYKSTISFSGVMEPSEPSDGSIPPVSFDKLTLDSFYDWESHEVSLAISAVVSLHPSTSSDLVNPNSLEYLFASVGYDSDEGTWTLSGDLRNINFGALLYFFKTEEHSQVKDIFGDITIISASLNYEYSEGKPSNFQFEGCMTIAKLTLDFLYERDAGGWEVKDGWQVKAALRSSYPCTLSDVISSICGDEAQTFQLPDFVGDIHLDIPEGDLGLDWENSPVYLNCSKPKDKSSAMVFSFQINLGKMCFMFLQLSYPSDKNAVAKKPKRMLMFSFTHLLPSLTIPVVGTIQSPIDGLQFLWVHDDNPTAGLTRTDVQEINDAVFGTTTGVLFKESKAEPTDTDIVITAGCHFMLLVNDSGMIKAVLDYKFAPKKKEQRKSDTRALMQRTVASGSSGSSSKAQDDIPGGVSKASVHKSVGPLSVSNIGLQYKDKKLFIVLDASLALGPISLSLLGLGIGAELSSDLFTNFKIADIGIELRGLAAALDKPPMLLAGLFEDMSTPTMELFAGGIAVNVKAYSFLAFGSYGIIHDQSKEYKTFFFFAQLSGPLVELEFATINGVTLGFGYNSLLKYPTVDDILDFPLVKGTSTESANDAASSSNVLTILSDAIFKTWVHPQDGSLWFAAGLEVFAFEALDVRAVAVIKIDPYVSFGLFADAVCSLPPAAPRNLCYIYVELGMVCEVDIKNGSFSVEGKLSPNSFVLHPSCHLVGGFAMYYWFDPSPHAGDFVFSIGGYHPSYGIPTYYPRPQRLAISWQLDDHIGITGQAFFAVTPKVCMGGALLSVLYSVGPLSAHLDAHAEFLMLWNPFHFVGDIGVLVGVSFQTKILFVNTHITADVSGTLHLEGPPFGGNVHVNFYLFGFDIYFGSRPDPPPALTLNQFWDLLSRTSNQQDSGKDTGITLVVQSGYAPQQNKNVTPPPQAPWLVLPGQFKFLVQCRFALSSVQIKQLKDSTKLSGTAPVYSKAMHCTEEITSTLYLTVTKSETLEVVEGFRLQAIEKNVPSAQWGKYVKEDDPSNNPRPASLLDGSNCTISRMLMGVMVAAPLPGYPDDGIPPYKAHDAMYIDILKGELFFPHGNPSSQAGSWLPAKEETTWDQAKDAWSGGSLLLASSKEIVDAWSKAFQWTDSLFGDAPAYLLKNFEAIYLDIPSLNA